MGGGGGTSLSAHGRPWGPHSNGAAPSPTQTCHSAVCQRQALMSSSRKWPREPRWMTTGVPPPQTWWFPNLTSGDREPLSGVQPRSQNAHAAAAPGGVRGTFRVLPSAPRGQSTGGEGRGCGEWNPSSRENRSQERSGEPRPDTRHSAPADQVAAEGCGPRGRPRVRLGSSWEGAPPRGSHRPPRTVWGGGS